MTDDTAKIILNQILTTLPDLVKATIEDYRLNPQAASLEIELQWKMLLFIANTSSGVLTEEDNHRLADELESSLLQIEEAMEEIDETARRSTPPLEKWQQVQYVDANPKPVESLWTEDELKQFTTKGA